MVAVDPSGGKIYITGGGVIEQANLDGSSPLVIVTGLDAVSGIGVDPEGGKIYWSDYVADKIQRANLDGTNVQDLVTNNPQPPLVLAAPWALAVDTDQGKVYWTDTILNRMMRANLDGTNVETVLPSLSGSERSLAIGR